MITASFNNIKIAGIAAAVPTKCVQAHEYDEVFGEETVSKNIKLTGIRQTYQLAENQTPSDLAFVAAKKLMQEIKIAPENIGVLIFVSPYFDYVYPATACVLHNRLGLSTDCIAFDLDLGCSGFVYGLSIVSSILQSLEGKCGLLLTAELGNTVYSSLDKSRLLFGAAGTATLVEKNEGSKTLQIAMKTDGTRFKSIIFPNSACRKNPNATHDKTLWPDGNTRSDYDALMDGTSVFSFSMTDVPKLAEEFFEFYNHSPDTFDAFILHQPNLFILKHLIKKLGSSSDKMPISLDRYGNTGSSAIPLTICDAYNNDISEKKLFLYGFGVGLSWACASTFINTEHIYPIEYTDDYFSDGILFH